MTDFVEVLRNAKHDKIKVLEQATGQEVDAYLRQNSQLSHDVIIVDSNTKNKKS
jgi:hypothetical protein